MYSIYRAWLSLNPCTGLPLLPELAATATPLNLTIPAPSSPPAAQQQHIPDTPDITLQVGPNLTHFSAHRAVLSAHSGYFKAALANYSDLLPLSVPNVNVEEFTALLTFMYTGFLDLNITNIYNILLATHILHMPTALELCRNYLLQQNQQHATVAGEQSPPSPPPPPRVHVIKPIASRKMAPHLQEIFTPNQFGGLNQSKDTLFRTVPTASTTIRTNDSQHRHHHRSTTSNKIELKSLHDEKKKTTTTTTTNGKSSSTYMKKRSSDSSSSSSSPNDNSSKAIIDIACCDGPVRFHRVINKSYGLRNLDNFNHQTSFKTTDAINKAINENMAEKLNNSEQQQSNNDIFTCVYCNHTFKSQYCYQKHARRHLYPATIDNNAAVLQTSPPPPPPTAAAAAIELPTIKKEIKLLDMNVQYYPCKTCGSKFPSYYFVHKHRKMCHAEEITTTEKTNRRGDDSKDENGTTNSNSSSHSNSSNSNSHSGTNNNTSSSSNSSIDVEAVQNESIQT